MSCSLVLFLVDSTRGLSGRRCQEAKPGLGNTRPGNHESGCGPSQMMHGRSRGQRGWLARWLAGWVGSRCCRIEDPEQRYVRSLTRLDLVDHSAGGSGHDPSAPDGPADTIAVNMILGRDRAGKVLRSQGADCFLIYVVCSTRLFPEATQLKPQRGPN